MSFFDKNNAPGHGVSGEVKTPDGKIHTIPSESKNITKPGDSDKGTSVGCSGTVKYNINTKDPKTGNFIGVSLQISAWCTLPCRYEHKEQAYAEAQRFVGEKVMETRSAYVQRFGLQQWFSG